MCMRAFSSLIPQKSKIKLKDNIFNVNIVDYTGKAPTPYGFDNSSTKAKDFSTGQEMIIENLQKIYKVVEPIQYDVEDLTREVTGNVKSSSSGSKKKNEYTIKINGEEKKIYGSTAVEAAYLAGYNKNTKDEFLI